MINVKNLWIKNTFTYLVQHGFEEFAAEAFRQALRHHSERKTLATEKIKYSNVHVDVQTLLRCDTLMLTLTRLTRKLEQFV